MQFLSVVPFLVSVLKEWLRIPIQIGGEKGGGGSDPPHAQFS